MCRLLGVSRSGYYAWRDREPSTRKKEDAKLTEEIRQAYVLSRGTYGSPRIHTDLQEAGTRVSRKRIARLMRENGIRARRRNRYQVTTDSNHSMPIAPNLLGRQFNVEKPNIVWASDLTYIWTAEGWLYLAVVMDLFSRRIVGWAMDNHMRTELVMKALEMAIKQRNPAPGVIHHSDRGSQYASHEYRAALETAGMVCSMSRKGDCWDNAVVEAFFSTVELELLDHSLWMSHQAARTAIHDFIEVFYNRRRRHSYLGNISPVAKEVSHSELCLAAA